MIYDYALMVPGQINPYPTIADKWRNASAVQCERPTVALLQTNKQIRAEARPSLYSNNVWVISYQLNPSVPRAIYDDNAHLFRHIALSLDPWDITNKERELVRRQVDTLILNIDVVSRREARRVYTPQDRYRFHVLANQQAFLDLIQKKLDILESIHRHGSLCSIRIDVTEVKNPLTGDRREMFEAMADRVDPKVWGTGLPNAIDDRDPGNRAFVKQVLRDPVHITKTKRRTLVLVGIHEEEVKILTRRADDWRPSVDSGVSIRW